MESWNRRWSWIDWRWLGGPNVGPGGLLRAASTSVSASQIHHTNSVSGSVGRFSVFELQNPITQYPLLICVVHQLFINLRSTHSTCDEWPMLLVGRPLWICPSHYFNGSSALINIMDRLIDDELHCTALLYHKRSLLHAAYNNHRTVYITSLNTTMLLYENAS